MTTDTLPASNYTRWGGAHSRWGSPAHFAESDTWEDGVHTVELGEGPGLDILFSGQPHKAGPVIPVFFNGAVTARETKASPFFSGAGLAAKAALPFIAVSDPSLNLDASLGLAWYAGNRFSNVQDQITETLAAIAQRSGRDLLFIGGSGGGFASIYYGGRLDTVASALVWNPQTDIHKYNPAFVDNYLLRAWGDEGCTADTSVVGSMPKRLLYMQNASDWHVPNHTQPYLEAGGFTHRGRGVFEADQNRVACLAQYGDGHAALPEPDLLTALNLMIDPSATASQVVDGLISRRATKWDPPAWSHPHLMRLPEMEVPTLGA